MGNCFSDVEGGKQAVGGAQQRPNSIATATNNNGGHNDAVEFFFRSRGIQPLFTQIEVIYVKYKVQKRQSQKLFQYFVILLYVYQNFPLHKHTKPYFVCVRVVLLFILYPNLGQKSVQFGQFL